MICFARIRHHALVLQILTDGSVLRSPSRWEFSLQKMSASTVPVTSYDPVALSHNLFLSEGLSLDLWGCCWGRPSLEDSSKRCLKRSPSLLQVVRSRGTQRWVMNINQSQLYPPDMELPVWLALSLGQINTYPRKMIYGNGSMLTNQ